MSCILESFTNSSPRLLCRERKLFFYQLVSQCIADSPCFFAQPVPVVQVHKCITTCEVPEKKMSNLIIVINIKDWTSLIRSISRVTTVLANFSSVVHLFSFLVVCSGMISTGFSFVAFFASVNASSVFRSVIPVV